MIREAITKVGTGRSIVIDEDDVVLAGNATITAATHAGLTKLRVVEADGDEVIAVRRRGLSSEQKRELAIYDNRTAELAEWDVEQLAEDVDAGLDLETFFEPVELDELLPPSDVEGLTDPDEIPAQRTTDIKPGDLFTLGDHRLLCGDSTKADDVGRVMDGATPLLMVTDPPYGVNYHPGWRRDAGVNKNPKKQGVVSNDDRSDWREAWALFHGSVAYVWHDWLKSGETQAALGSSGFHCRSMIVWAKDRPVFSRGHYHGQHEVAYYAVRKNGGAAWCGDRSQSTLWTIPTRDDDGHGHGTQKPVKCMQRPIRNHAGEVYDPFCGSGTTIIAAEQLGRKCYAIEIEPSYCQVIIDRWEAFTGKTANKVA
jgi:DNA modification methylase